MLVSAPDYKDTLITNIFVDSLLATIVNVKLLPDITFELEIFVDDIQTSNPIQDVKISLYKNGNFFFNSMRP